MSYLTSGGSNGELVASIGWQWALIRSDDITDTFASDVRNINTQRLLSDTILLKAIDDIEGSRSNTDLGQLRKKLSRPSIWQNILHVCNDVSEQLAKVSVLPTKNSPLALALSEINGLANEGWGTRHRLTFLYKTNTTMDIHKLANAERLYIWRQLFRVFYDLDSPNLPASIDEAETRFLRRDTHGMEAVEMYDALMERYNKIITYPYHPKIFSWHIYIKYMAETYQALYYPEIKGRVDDNIGFLALMTDNIEAGRKALGLPPVVVGTSAGSESQITSPVHATVTESTIIQDNIDGNNNRSSTPQPEASSCDTTSTADIKTESKEDLPPIILHNDSNCILSWRTINDLGLSMSKGVFSAYRPGSPYHFLDKVLNEIE